MLMDESIKKILDTNQNFKNFYDSIKPYIEKSQAEKIFFIAYEELVEIKKAWLDAESPDHWFIDVCWFMRKGKKHFLCIDRRAPEKAAKFFLPFLPLAEGDKIEFYPEPYLFGALYTIRLLEKQEQDYPDGIVILTKSEDEKRTSFIPILWRKEPNNILLPESYTAAETLMPDVNTLNNLPYALTDIIYRPSEVYFGEDSLYYYMPGNKRINVQNRQDIELFPTSLDSLSSFLKGKDIGATKLKLLLYLFSLKPNHYDMDKKAWYLWDIKFIKQKKELKRYASETYNEVFTHLYKTSYEIERPYYEENGKKEIKKGYLPVIQWISKDKWSKKDGKDYAIIKCYFQFHEYWEYTKKYFSLRIIDLLEYMIGQGHEKESILFFHLARKSREKGFIPKKIMIEDESKQKWKGKGSKDQMTKYFEISKEEIYEIVDLPLDGSKSGYKTITEYLNYLESHNLIKIIKSGSTFKIKVLEPK